MCGVTHGLAGLSRYGKALFEKILFIGVAQLEAGVLAHRLV
jgi:hypothetical protein